MRYLKLLIVFLFILVGCRNDDDTIRIEPSSVQIGNYLFTFPNKFTIEEEQGIDSYVGNVYGSGISISFDYGQYTSPVSDLPEDEYFITEVEIEGHYKQIVKPMNSQEHYTRIHLFKISDSIESPDSYNSLTMLTNNLTIDEQDMIIAVFNNVEIVE